MKKADTDPVYERALLDCIEVRDIDVDARSATFVAATESGVETYRGKEYLRMEGVKLTRYKRNPVVLDTHNRYEAGAVIAIAKATVEDRQLVAKVTFAETARASEIWELVRTGFLKAVSIGFIPDASKTVRLAEGETDGEGEGEIVGPAIIINKWELFEISIVPVPADANALRRGFFDSDGDGLLPVIHSLAESLQRLTAENSKKEIDMDRDKKGEAPATVVEIKTPTETLVVPSTPEEDAGRSLAALTVAIRAIAPRGMDKVADELIAQGVDVPTARKRFIEELAKGSEPVGTPEPPEPPQGGEETDTRAAELPDAEFKRAICG